MEQEDKELLLVELCARLPYKVMVHIRYNTKEPCYSELTPKDIQWFIDSKIYEEIRKILLKNLFFSNIFRIFAL